MTRLLGLLFAMALFLSATTLCADDGQIPDASLAQFGLGGAEVVSDVDGEQIRGKYLFGPNFIGSVFVSIYYAGGQSNEALDRANQVANALNTANTIAAFAKPRSPYNNPNVHKIDFTVPYWLFQ